MLPFEVLIIPLIALAVLILGTVFAKTEEPPRRRPARLPGEGGRPLPRGTTDLEQFLEEARRRRGGTPSRQADRPAQELPAPARPSARPEPPRPQRTAERRPPRRELPRSAAPAPRPARPEPPAPVVAMEVVETIPPARQDGKPVQEDFPIGVLAPVRRPVSPAAAQVVKMLRTPGSPAVAYLLREILEPPLCKRRRH